MLKEVREQFDYSYTKVMDSLLAIDVLLSEYEENRRIISDVDEFIYRLKDENLYTDDLGAFIERYLSFYNE